MKTHGPITGIAEAAHKFILQQPNLLKALEVGRNCFPGMSDQVLTRIYEKRASVWFSEHGNKINVGWTT